MLIKTSDLLKIKKGEISLLFRKWKRPQVKSGSIINSAIGQLKIVDVAEVEAGSITEEEVRNAGFTQRKQLTELLEEGNRTLFRIHIRYHGKDPRIDLGNMTSITDEQMKVLQNQLAGFDQRSKYGPWTRVILKTIAVHPGKRAQELADELGFEKTWLKNNIRKLKKLGLTWSLDVGYKLSKRGDFFVKNSNQQN